MTNLTMPPTPQEFTFSIWRAAWLEVLRDCPVPYGLYERVIFPGASQQFPILIRHEGTGHEKWVDERQAAVFARSGWREVARMKEERLIWMGQF